MTMRFIEAVLVLVGMIIGVGMFGIPFSFAQAGFLLGSLELIVLTGLIVVTHLIYGEIVLATKGSHRLPGYVRMYLGSGWGALAWFSTVLGTLGTLLAYLIVGSSFLGHSLWAAPQWLLVLLLGAVVALVTCFPLRKEALLNGFFTVLLVGFLIFLVIVLLPGVSFREFSAIRPASLFLPYGILLFALSGGVAIPDVVSLLRGDRRRSRSAIVVGTAIPALLYFFFALAVVGVSGSGTTKEAIQGLAGVVSPRIIFLGNLIGLLAVFTSFVVLAANAQALLRFDLAMPRRWAWGAVSVAPLLLYFLGFQDFIVVIGAVGALAVGVDSALLLMAHHALAKKSGVSISQWSVLGKCLIYVMIAAGIIYQFLP